MPIYNLLKSSDNYSMTPGSLWNYYRDEVNYNDNENDNANHFHGQIEKIRKQNSNK